jgi:hypothetical protein
LDTCTSATLPASPCPWRTHRNPGASPRRASGRLYGSVTGLCDAQPQFDSFARKWLAPESRLRSSKSLLYDRGVFPAQPRVRRCRIRPAFQSAWSGQGPEEFSEAARTAVPMWRAHGARLVRRASPQNVWPSRKHHRAQLSRLPSFSSSHIAAPPIRQSQAFL